MATLRLAGKDLTVAAALNREHIVSLRDWLQGQWGAVCSDPDDLAPPRGTPAGFITCIAEGLRATGLKLIAFDRTSEPARPSWLDHAVNDDALVLLDRGDACVIDLAERALATRLATNAHRFVVIVDERGRIRTTINYRAGDRSRSLFDVVELVSQLRDGAVDSQPIRHAGALSS
jgi:alkyl hydroperoxide reductase subunit AhpC